MSAIAKNLGAVLSVVLLLALPTLLALLPAAQSGAEETAPDSPDASVAAVAVGDALLERQQEDGAFLDPPGGPGSPSRWRDGPLLEDWRLLVHAEACRALFELYDLTGQERFRIAAERGLWFLGSRLEAPAAQEGMGQESAAVRKVGDRLDTTAATLLAALEWLQVSPPSPGAETEAALASPRAVARYLLARQVEDPQAADLGAFRSPSPYPWPLPRTPGLVTLALARLAAVDPACGPSSTCPWRRGAEAGAGWMMAVRDLGKDFDHLPQEGAGLLALDALHRADPATGDSYFLHARRIGDGILRRVRRETGPGVLRRAEWVVGLVAVWRISDRSAAEDAPRFRRGAVESASVLLEELGDPTERSVSDLRRILPALTEAWKLDRDAHPW
jgi:hypothetical protein